MSLVFASPCTGQLMTSFDAELQNIEAAKDQINDGTTPPTIAIFKNPLFRNHMVFIGDIQCAEKEEDVYECSGGEDCQNSVDYEELVNDGFLLDEGGGSKVKLSNPEYSSNFEYSEGSGFEQPSEASGFEQSSNEIVPVNEEIPTIPLSSTDSPTSCELLILYCDAKGKPDTTQQWYHNDRLITRDMEGFEMDETNKTLSLIGGDTNNNHLPGDYYCQAKNIHGLAKSEVLYVFYGTSDESDYINEDKIPKVKPPKSNYVEYFKSNISLTCEVENDVSYDVTWTKNGEVIDDENTDTFVIERFDDASKGNYACNVSNEYGYSYHNIFQGILNVSPEFIEEPLSDNTYPGKGLFFRCSVKGYPLPTLTWEWKGDDDVEYTEISENADGVCSVLQLEKGLTSNCKKVKIENSFSDTNENKLVESQLTIEDIKLGDSGSYRCVAGNQGQNTSGNR